MSAEAGADNRAGSLKEVSSLDNDHVTMHLESVSSASEITADENSAIDLIDCYCHFISDEISRFMVRETIRYAEQYLLKHSLSN